MAEARVKYTSDTRQVETGAKRVKGTFDRLKSSALSVGKAIAAAFVVRAVARFGVAVFRAAASFDAMKRGLKAVIPAGEDLEKTLSRIKGLAKEPGLGFREALEGVTRLRAVGVGAAQAEAILKAFGNSVALVGGGKAELLQAVDAVSKMGAEGKITEERLNQLALNMPTLRKVMQDTFGAGTAEGINKLGFSVDDFLAKLVDGMDRQEQATGGAANAVDNLADAYDQLQITIGETFAEGATKQIEAMTAAMELFAGEIQEGDSKAQSLIKSMANLYATAANKAGESIGNLVNEPRDSLFIGPGEIAGVKGDKNQRDIQDILMDPFNAREALALKNARAASARFSREDEPDPFAQHPGSGGPASLAMRAIARAAQFASTLDPGLKAQVPGFQAGASSSLASIGGGGGVGAAPITRRLDNQIKATKAVETAVKEINLDLTLR